MHVGIIELNICTLSGSPCVRVMMQPHDFGFLYVSERSAVAKNVLIRACPSLDRVTWWRGWGPLVVLPTAVLLFHPPRWPPWAVMWLLALGIFAGCKWLTWRRTPLIGVSFRRQLAYLVAWPGLDANRFLDSASSVQSPPPSWGEWIFALAKLGLGLGILYGLTPLLPETDPYWVGWVGMIGVVMVLHFGLFHLLSCAWRREGIQARPLMQWPLLSVSLSEFWGRRWNTAFRDLTHRFLFRPLSSRLGARQAVLAGFLFSGLVHDLVISVPSGGGYGGPTAYFLFQGVGIQAERSRLLRPLRLGVGWTGWLFTMTVLLAPAGLLFHRPFVLHVVVPFLQAIEAIQ